MKVDFSSIEVSSRKLTFAWLALLLLPITVAGQDTDLRWNELPSMPDAISGHFAGISGDSLVIVGGANFPDKSPFAGGTKAWYDRIAILTPNSERWQTGYRFPRTAAYGVSASHNGRLICAGGGNGDSHSRDVTAITVTKTGVQLEDLPKLPQPCSFTSGTIVADRLFVVGGQIAPDSQTALKTFWRLDLSAKNGEWESIAPWPGPGRILSVVTSAGDDLYLFSGASLKIGEDGSVIRDYLIDAYRYSCTNETWTKLPDLPTPTVAGTAAADGNRILVFSGDTGENFFRTAELGDSHPGFRKDVFAFDLQKQSWSVAGKIPLGVVTTNAVLRTQGGKQSIVIPGGEDRPGHRVPNVLSLQLTDE